MTDDNTTNTAPPKLADSEIANFCRRLAQSTAIDADNLMMFAEDILTNEGGNERALMLLNGMRAGGRNGGQ